MTAVSRLEKSCYTRTMAIKLDQQLLQRAGVRGIGSAGVSQVLKALYTCLETRAGMRLAERMSPAQLDEFEDLLASGEEAAAFAWLGERFPDYSDLCADVADSRPDLRSSRWPVPR
jgi:Protein of unknown function (DUF5663)